MLIEVQGIAVTHDRLRQFCAGLPFPGQGAGDTGFHRAVPGGSIAGSAQHGSIRMTIRFETALTERVAAMADACTAAASASRSAR